MKKYVVILLFISLFISHFWIFNAEAQGEIPATVVKRMKKFSWREGCPVPINDLVYLHIPYWGFDNKTHQGELIVHQDVAKEVQDIFKELFEHRFSIKRISLVDDYRGNDTASMDHNNTSAFNCRAVTNHPGVFSKHSYGKAIDINPLINPYIAKNSVEPKKGKKYVDRSKSHPGMISSGDIVYKAFIRRGWKWGGDWKSLKDYQHFEKE